MSTSANSARRALLFAAAALPAGAVLAASGPALAAAEKLVVFHGVQRLEGPGIDVVVFGWAARTAEGWTGRVVDAPVSDARAEFPGTAAGATQTVPRGMANVINGHTDKDGVRAAGVCFEKVTEATVEGSKVRLVGVLTEAENPVIFKIGDPMTLEGNAETGEFVYSLRGNDKDNVFNLKGTILVA